MTRIRSRLHPVHQLPGRVAIDYWGLNANGPTTDEILERLDMSVSEFVGLVRKGSSRRKLLAEALDSTLREAFDSGDPKVRKLLLDRRWRR